jgi:NlpC/P60 family/Transglycosylase SLT domain
MITMRNLSRRSAARDEGAGSIIAVLAIAGFVIIFCAILIPLLFLGGSCGATSATQPTPSDNATSIPANYLTLYQQAGQAYGISWPLLAAVGSMESDHGRSTQPGVHSGENSAGAGGPMQFLAGTWRAEGVNGNGDGKKDRYDPADAIPGAANYLKHLGITKDARTALYHYNGQGAASWAYADRALALAKGYASGGFSVGGANTAGSNACAATGGPATMGNANGSFGERIVYYASKWLGTPYSWGGGSLNGPTYGIAQGAGIKGFDCSHLVWIAVYHASGNKIILVPPASAQYHGSHVQHVSYDQLQVGDLVFFHALTHVGIYIGGGKMINAPHTGDVVRTAVINTGYYRANFVGGARVTRWAG